MKYAIKLTAACLFLLFAIGLCAFQSATIGILPDGGPNLPAKCNVGQIYFKTSATVGLNQCTAADTWTAVPLTSGGITNSAGNNVIPKSNGTNIVASSLSDNGTNVATGEYINATSGFSPTVGSTPTTIGYSQSGSSTIFRGGDSAVSDFYFQQQSAAGTTPLHVNALGAQFSGVVSMGNSATLTADWTCGTAGTVSSCTAAQIIGSGGGVPLTVTLPLIALSWTVDCNLLVGQATAATANSWNIITSSNGPTNVMALYQMNTAPTAMAGGALTGGSGTATQVIAPTWTLGATGTKMPVHIWARVEGASASGTVISLQLVAPTVADLVTIYRGSSCRVM